MLRWRPTQEEIVFLLAALMFCGFLAASSRFSGRRKSSVAGAQRLDPRHPRARHGAGRDRPRHRSGDGRDHGRVGVLGRCSVAHAIAARLRRLRSALVFVVGVGLVSGILVAYAEIPAIFTTLAMGSSSTASAAPVFFQIDVQNAPAGYCLVQLPRQRPRLRHPGRSCSPSPPGAGDALPAALDALRPLRLRERRQSAGGAHHRHSDCAPLIVAQYISAA